MKKITVMMIVFAVFMSCCLLAIGFSFKESIRQYTSLEGDLVEATTLYLDKANLDLEYNKPFKIKGKELVKEGFINSLKTEEDEECEAYVMVERKSEIDIKAYIKCDKYTTKNYE